jgi:hypothetical protein
MYCELIGDVRAKSNSSKSIDLSVSGVSTSKSEPEENPPLGLEAPLPVLQGIIEIYPGNLNDAWRVLIRRNHTCLYMITASKFLYPDSVRKERFDQRHTTSSWLQPRKNAVASPDKLVLARHLMLVYNQSRQKKLSSRFYSPGQPWNMKFTAAYYFQVCLDERLVLEIFSTMQGKWQSNIRRVFLYQRIYPGHLMFCNFV